MLKLDHGCIPASWRPSSWDRQPYLNYNGVDDGFHTSVEHPNGSSIIRAHDFITRNFIINGYNGVWTIDHDDGSQVRSAGVASVAFIYDTGNLAAGRAGRLAVDPFVSLSPTTSTPPSTTTIQGTSLCLAAARSGDRCYNCARHRVKCVVAGVCACSLCIRVYFERS